MNIDKPEINIGSPVIFTSGAFVSPGRVTVNGREMCCWIVESFEDNSYYDGEVVYPRANSYNKEDLLAMTESEFDRKPRVAL